MGAAKVRVLLADDHRALLESLRSLFEPAYDVIAAVTDGHSLVETAVALRPDVIVSDISMPGLNGLDAATRVKESLPGVCLVFFTVDEDPDTAAEAIRRGARGYVVKTAATSELLEAVRQALHGHTCVVLA